MKIKKDYNFAKAATEINGNSKENVLRINEIFKMTIELKEKAVNELREIGDENLYLTFNNIALAGHNK